MLKITNLDPAMLGEKNDFQNLYDVLELKCAGSAF